MANLTPRSPLIRSGAQVEIRVVNVGYTGHTLIDLIQTVFKRTQVEIAVVAFVIVAVFQFGKGGTEKVGPKPDEQRRPDDDTHQARKMLEKAVKAKLCNDNVTTERRDEHTSARQKVWRGKIGNDGKADTRRQYQQKNELAVGTDAFETAYISSIVLGVGIFLAGLSDFIISFRVYRAAPTANTELPISR